jgi:SAM-dependent methyltransferase
MPDTTSYDASLSEDYSTIFDQKNKFNWLVQILEAYTIQALPVDRNVAILDVACGVGSLCWRLARMGYRDVVGVDVSASQIGICHSTELAMPSNLSYFRMDARRLQASANFGGRFDIVNASWLYDTASDESELLEMASGIRHCMKPGGVHCGMEVNFDIKASGPREFEEYGVSLLPNKAAGYRPRNGETVRAHLYAGNETASRSGNRFMVTDVTFFDEAAYRRVFLKAGFRDVRFHPPQNWKLGERWSMEFEIGRFQKYVATNPEMIAFTASS